MDIKNYISSGILEEYVMGVCSEKEIKEVECLRAIHPEIHEELKAIETSLLMVAEANAIQVSSSVKDQLLEKVMQLENESVQQTLKEKTTPQNTEEENPQSSSVWKYLAIIFVPATIILLVYLFNIQRKNSESKSYYEEQIQKNDSTQQVLRDQLDKIKMENKMLLDFENEKIMLTGSDAHPGMLCLVLWNKKNNETCIFPGNLPMPPKEKNYQVWAIYDNQKVSLGMLDMKENSNLQLIDSTSKPKAFAITLEKKEGVEHPSLDQLYAIGGF